MEKKKIGFEMLIFNDASELSQNEQKLLREASMARQNAYAPYSKFRVGAAVLLENGEVIIGSNQENASYPAGLCAERVAIFHAGPYLLVSMSACENLCNSAARATP